MKKEAAVKKVLEEKVRPLLKAHGGDARLSGYEDGIVLIKLLGACSGCPSADLSTKGLIEDILRRDLPEVKGVELEQTVDSEMLEFAGKILYPEGK